ncbi:peptidoglycan/LPS O-acetylase OafA/YrhL [Crossiella equi]|uniref:Peptidoglycan/LPS O-acetylase OafA/YrhL n=1 Tax=Crossiella equi TaxID=130796 RepID=A0ABS5AP89_9PSEU|nr:acyltransferase family protein [Crossiella equi]MBP2478376.1 peptidoglycan/LPS O-acetylase OafA/YrhL [Crossiella equi]
MPTDTTALAPPQTPARVHRPELQGLRAVAVGLVVVYHVWLNRVSGGVDVFFLVSGFLVTGQLVRAVERGGIRYREQWRRTALRLLPSAAVVLAVTAVAAMVVLPQERWFQTIREVVASGLFLENWQLVADSADYFAQNNMASVTQHFWSLSIQGQFYLVWPLLIGLLALVAAQNGRRLRPYLAGALAVLGGASLLYSVVLTAADQPFAYFHSLTRVWEFALGGLLALGINRVVVGRGARIVLGWAGVLGLLSCGLVFNVGSVFPGYAALWPTLSAALVLLAGATGSAHGVDRWLGSRPLTRLGDLSYALYLWHWPVLVLFLVHRGEAEVGLGDGIGVIAVSLLLAQLTHWLVETPLRRSAAGMVRVLAFTLAPVLALTAGWQLAAWHAANPSARAGDVDHPGALAHAPGFQYQGRPDAELYPPRIALAQDWATLTDLDCTRSARNGELEMCVLNPEAEPVKRLVVVGDSHMQQYLAAVKPLARKNNWQVTAMIKGLCPFSEESETLPGDQGCADYNAAAAEEIVQRRPDAVLTLASRDVRAGLSETTPAGFVRQWQRLAEHDIKVLAVRDNPRYGHSPALCAYDHGPASGACAVPRAELYAPEPPYRLQPDVPTTVTFLDFSDYFCGPDLCMPSVGNVLVYLDDNHTTAAFMSTLAPALEAEVQRVLG